MTYFLLHSHARLPLSSGLKITCLSLISILAWLWGFKTTGVLENTMLFEGNPLGYSYLLESFSFGIWPINRESLYYLTGMQAFLGVNDATLPFGNGYEISRTLYCLLLRSFWFLEPIMASLVLDVILWLLAALSSATIASTFSKNPIAPWIAAFFVIFGQGFLHSVGEGVPHVLGYAGGFYIGALICLFRSWTTSCRFGEDLVIYVFIALWQIGYGTALFFLPLALFCTAFRLKALSIPYAKQILILGSFTLIALFPFFFITTVMKFISKLPGETGMVLALMQNNYASVSDYLLAYATVFLDGLLSLGPTIVVACLWLCWAVFYKKYKDLQILALIFLAQYILMIALITPLYGRGYATYNLVLIPVIFLSLVLSDLFKSSTYKKMLATFFVLLGFIFYPHLMKIGYRLPNAAFQTGWFDKLSSRWQAYEIHTFK